MFFFQWILRIDYINIHVVEALAAAIFGWIVVFFFASEEIFKTYDAGRSECVDYSDENLTGKPISGL